MTFLPQGYTIPTKASNYMKFQTGLNRIRILSSAIVGYQYFTNDNKPVRSKTLFKTTPDIKNDGMVKPFWAFCVWNYQEECIQILELTQKSIMFAIQSLAENTKWGDPKMYDIAITKIGEKLETEYSVQGEPPITAPAQEILDVYNKLSINLEALYTGNDPFAAKTVDVELEVSKSVDDDSTPPQTPPAASGEANMPEVGNIESEKESAAQSPTEANNGVLADPVKDLPQKDAEFIDGLDAEKAGKAVGKGTLMNLFAAAKKELNLEGVAHVKTWVETNCDWLSGINDLGNITQGDAEKVMLAIQEEGKIRRAEVEQAKK